MVKTNIDVPLPISLSLSRYQLGERNIWCKETNFNLATHVPLMIRVPTLPDGKGGFVPSTRTASTKEIVEIVDMFPTMSDLAGARPLDPTVKGEPPLGGKSLAPLILKLLAGASPGADEGGRSAGDEKEEEQKREAGEEARGKGGDQVAVSVAYSQYSRFRCRDNLFYAPKKTVPATGKQSCALSGAQHYTGFSVRRDVDSTSFSSPSSASASSSVLSPGDGLRYTRWVNVSVAGDPFWDEVEAEELYVEKAADGDAFDESESYGNWASLPEHNAELVEMRALLKQGFAPNGQK